MYKFYKKIFKNKLGLIIYFSFLLFLKCSNNEQNEDFLENKIPLIEKESDSGQNHDHDGHYNHKKKKFKEDYEGYDEDNEKERQKKMKENRKFEGEEQQHEKAKEDEKEQQDEEKESQEEYQQSKHNEFNEKYSTKKNNYQKKRLNGYNGKNLSMESYNGHENSLDRDVPDDQNFDDNFSNHHSNNNLNSHENSLRGHALKHQNSDNFRNHHSNNNLNSHENSLNGHALKHQNSDNFRNHHSNNNLNGHENSLNGHALKHQNSENFSYHHSDNNLNGHENRLDDDALDDHNSEDGLNDNYTNGLDSNDDVNDQVKENGYYNYKRNDSGKSSFFSLINKKNIDTIGHMVHKVSNAVKTGTQIYGDIKKGNLKQAITDAKTLEKEAKDPETKKMISEGGIIFKDVHKHLNLHQIRKKKTKKKLNKAKESKDIALKIRNQSEEHKFSKKLDRSLLADEIENKANADIEKHNRKLDELEKNKKALDIHSNIIDKTIAEADNLNERTIHPAKSLKLISIYLLHISKMINKSKSPEATIKFYKILAENLEIVNKMYMNILNFMKKNNHDNEIIIYAYSLIDPNKTIQEIESENINKSIIKNHDFLQLKTFKDILQNLKTAEILKDITNEIEELESQNEKSFSNKEMLKRMKKEIDPFKERKEEMEELKNDESEIKGEKKNSTFICNNILRHGQTIENRLKKYKKYDEIIKTQETYINNKNEIIVIHQEEKEALKQIENLISSSRKSLNHINIHKEKSELNKEYLEKNIKDIEKLKDNFRDQLNKILNKNKNLKEKLGKEIKSKKNNFLETLHSHLCNLYVSKFKFNAEIALKDYDRDHLGKSIIQINTLEASCQSELKSMMKNTNITSSVYVKELEIIYTQILTELTNQIYTFYKEKLENNFSILRHDAYKEALDIKSKYEALKKDIGILGKNIKIDVYKTNLQELKNEYKEKIENLNKTVDQSLKV